MIAKLKPPRERRNARPISSELLRVQEAERRAVARELHDEIGQLLTALRIMIESDSTDSPRRSEVLSLLDELMARVRDLSSRLRPALLDELGLAAALDRLCDRLTSTNGPRVSLSRRGMGSRLAPELETAIFRIVQEALTNVARHAEATEARVGITVGATDVDILIEDDGRGCDLEAARREDRFGLSGMAERARLVGGSLEVESVPGHGTRVHALLPAAVERPARTASSR